MDALLPRFFEIAAVCAAIYLVGFCYRGVSKPKTIFKTLSIAALAVVAILSQAPLWLSLALIACAAGDYFLSLEDTSSFLVGVGSFAMGHVFYIVLFLTDPQSSFELLHGTPRIAVLSFLGFMATIMLLLLWGNTGGLRYPVTGYIFIITVMGVAAATLPWQDQYGSVLLGVMFFVISDMILASEMFLLSNENSLRKYTPFLIWIFYWVAQLLITAGIVLRGL